MLHLHQLYLPENIVCLLEMLKFYVQRKQNRRTIKFDKHTMLAYINGKTHQEKLSLCINGKHIRDDDFLMLSSR